MDALSILQHEVGRFRVGIQLGQGAGTEPEVRLRNITQICIDPLGIFGQDK